MNLSDAERELLLVFLNGRPTVDVQRQVTDLLRSNEAARDFLRDVAEQAVVVADIERVAIGRCEALGPSLPHSPSRERSGGQIRRDRWLRAAAVTIGVLLCLGVAASAYAYLVSHKPEIARVRHVGGIVQFRSSAGQADVTLTTGYRLVAGDAIEARSCNGWVELDLDGLATLSIGGRSSLRLLQTSGNERRFELLSGYLWISPVASVAGSSVVVQTPIAELTAIDALLSLQTSDTETVVRVHQGAVRVRSALDGAAVDVPPGHQVSVTLASGKSIVVIPQRTPVDRWRLDPTEAAPVSFGQILPSHDTASLKIRAAPLLWPLPNRDPILLHVVGVAAWKSSDHPIRLEPGAKMRFRGRLERSNPVRFGFSTQKVQGIFSGKFEIEIPAERLGPVGETWQIDIPLSDFQAIHRQAVSTSERLELTDVYALTIVNDAGLEIHHIELLSPLSEIL